MTTNGSNLMFSKRGKTKKYCMLCPQHIQNILKFVPAVIQLNFLTQYYLLISPSTTVHTNAKEMPFGPYGKDTKDKSGNKSHLCLHRIGVSINSRYIIGSNTCSSSSNRVQRRLKREVQELKQLSKYHTKISTVSIVYYT